MRVIAYTYDADMHCVACAQARFKDEALRNHEAVDENGIPLETEDSEGNPIHPVFSTDELSDGYACGDCHQEIS